MKWDYWISLYLHTHCVARGLRPLSIAAYGASLHQFRTWIEKHHAGKPPDVVVARDVLEYLEHLRRDRDNGDSAVNRAVVVLRSFYRAIDVVLCVAVHVAGLAEAIRTRPSAAGTGPGWSSWGRSSS